MSPWIVICVTLAYYAVMSSAKETLSDISTGLDLFTVPLSELEKAARPVTTLDDQCRQFLPHFKYYFRTSNIAKYNEEVRIICERYEAYCNDRVLPSVNHIRRQIVMWRQQGLPKAGVRALEMCYTQCRETDPVCVNACECLHLSWVMDWQCQPQFNTEATTPNCQRWATRCKKVWRPDVDITPATRSEMAPPPIVRGIFYGYDAIGTHRTFDRPRDHGVSFFRGTKQTFVNWPEGKISTSSNIEVPFAGVDVTYNAVDIGIPNMRAAYNSFTKENPDPLNSGTGRVRSSLAAIRRQS